MKVHCGGCIVYSIYMRIRIKRHLNTSSIADEFFAVWQFFQGTCHTYFGSNLGTFKVHNRDRLPLIPDEATISEQECNTVLSEYQKEMCGNVATTNDCYTVKGMSERERRDICV